MRWARLPTISRPTLTSLKASIDYEHHNIRIPGHRSPIQLLLSSAVHHTINALCTPSANRGVALVAAPAAVTHGPDPPGDDSTGNDAPPTIVGHGAVAAASVRRQTS